MMAEKLTILVADDSRVILKAFSRIMGEHYELVEANDGQRAWDLLESNADICAVFSDWEMPHIDGIGLAKKIRASKNPRISSLPIIMVTSKNENEETKQEAFNAGVTDFVAKPFDKTELLARAKAHVKPIDVEGQSDDGKAVLNPQSRIGNMSYFQQQAIGMIAFCARHNLPVSLVLIGVDNLTSLVEKYHLSEKQVEELVLTIGAHITEIIRKDDSVAHLSKRVLGVLLSSADLVMAARFAKRLQSIIAARSFNLNGTEVNITLSFGMQTAPAENPKPLPALFVSAREHLLAALRVGNDIQPLPDTGKRLERIDSLDKALARVTHQKTDDLDLLYTLKRMLPLLAKIDREIGTHMSKSALEVIKGDIESHSVVAATIHEVPPTPEA